MCEWFSLVGFLKFFFFFFFSSHLNFGFYWSILNSFSWKTKFPAVPLSMLLSKLPSSLYKKEVWMGASPVSWEWVSAFLNHHIIKEEESCCFANLYFFPGQYIHLLTYAKFILLLYSCLWSIFCIAVQIGLNKHSLNLKNRPKDNLEDLLVYLSSKVVSDSLDFSCNPSIGNKLSWGNNLVSTPDLASKFSMGF